MATASSSRLAKGALLLAGTAWVAPAFVPSAGGKAEVGVSSTVLRGAAPASGLGESGATGSLAPLGLAALTLTAGALVGKQQRQPAAARQFFGGNAAPPPKKVTSYKDFNDPWLGSADLSFDPLNLAVQGGIFDNAASAVAETTYYNYRESEVKHGRFAMGAFLAIFAESADRNALGRQLGANVVDNLDGTLGLDEVQLPVLLTTLGYQALAEYNLQRDETDGNILSVEYKKDRIPGNLGFDPLGLSKGPSADVKGLHNVEVNAGRLAMIGITSFLFKEFIAKDPEIASKIGRVLAFPATLVGK